MNNKVWKIYKVTSPSNKIYIGMTSLTVEQRKNFHTLESKKELNKNCNNYFHNAIRKYKDQLNWKIIEDNLTAFSIAQEREKYWIKYFNSSNPLVGYNGTYGGEGSQYLTDEVKKKISISVALANKIRFLDPEVRAKQAEYAARGRNAPGRLDNLRKTRQSEESRRKTSTDSKIRYSNQGNRDKMALACGGKPFHVWKKDGTYVGRYINQAFCASDLKLTSKKHISNCLNLRRSQYLGFVFAFEGEKPKQDGRFNTHVEYIIPREKENKNNETE